MRRELVINADEAVRQFVDRVNQRVADYGPSRAIGILVDGEMVAGVIYNDFRDKQISMHVSALNPSWASRGIVTELLAFAFIRCEVVRVNAIVSAMNKKAQKLLRQLGFVCEGMHPLGWRGTEIALSFGMTRDQASRWLDDKENGDGRQIRPTATARA